jgi:hypothetical protein
MLAKIGILKGLRIFALPLTITGKGYFSQGWLFNFSSTFLRLLNGLLCILCQKQETG